MFNLTLIGWLSLQRSGCDTHAIPRSWRPASLGRRRSFARYWTCFRIDLFVLVCQLRFLVFLVSRFSMYILVLFSDKTLYSHHCRSWSSLSRTEWWSLGDTAYLAWQRTFWLWYETWACVRLWTLLHAPWVMRPDMPCLELRRGDVAHGTAPECYRLFIWYVSSAISSIQVQFAKWNVIIKFSFFALR